MRAFFITIAVLLILATCSACSVMPTSLRAEVEHVSHPLAGWPVSADNTEDGLSQVNVVAHWQHGRLYVENALGYNLQGENGGGFYGPGLTYTGRVGVQLFGR